MFDKGLTHKTVLSVDGVQTDLSSSRIITNSRSHNIDLSAEKDARDKVIIVNHAMENGKYIKLPESTAANIGKHIRVIFAFRVLGAFAVGFESTTIIGSATLIGAYGTYIRATTQGGTESNPFVHPNYKSIRFADETNKRGGESGSVLDFYYVDIGRVVYRGNLITLDSIESIDGHFSESAVVHVGS